MDRALIAAWLKLNERACPNCRRPLALHKAETDEKRAEGMDDEMANRAAAAAYAAAYLTCPATLALDAQQVLKRNEATEEAARKAGYDPERSRSWITIREGEEPPTFDD